MCLLFYTSGNSSHLGMRESPCFFWEAGEGGTCSKLSKLAETDGINDFKTEEREPLFASFPLFLPKKEVHSAHHSLLFSLKNGHHSAPHPPCFSQTMGLERASFCQHSHHRTGIERASLSLIFPKNQDRTRLVILLFSPKMEDKTRLVMALLPKDGG